MSQKLSKPITLFGIMCSLIFLHPAFGNTQIPEKRIRENFDFDWQFHKGDIAIKNVVRVGQGGLTERYCGNCYNPFTNCIEQ